METQKAEPWHPIIDFDGHTIDLRKIERISKQILQFFRIHFISGEFVEIKDVNQDGLREKLVQIWKEYNNH